MIKRIGKFLGFVSIVGMLILIIPLGIFKLASFSSAFLVAFELTDYAGIGLVWCGGLMLMVLLVASILLIGIVSIGLYFLIKKCWRWAA